LINQEKKVSTLLKTFHIAYEKLGYDKLSYKLNEAISTTLGDYETSILSFIIDLVCNDYNLKLKDLKKENIRGIKVEARSMCILLIKKHLNLPHEKIAYLFNRNNHSIVSQAIQDFKTKKLSYKVKREQLFVDNYNKYDKKINNYKEFLEKNK
tara:strand:+ start:635 stop:1093 length:459 start_codon:yes stop_codon:yes gene_type:complete